MVNSIQGTSQSNYSFLPDQDDIASGFGGDASAELAAMVFLFSRERSKDAAFTRDRLEQGIQAQQDIQIDKLHDAADAKFAAAVVDGLSSIASGLAQVASVADAEHKGELEGSAAIFKGEMQIVGGIMTSYALDSEADAKEAENNANTSIRALETVQEDRTDAQDMKQRTLDFLGAIEESKAEANKALVNIRV